MKEMILEAANRVAGKDLPQLRNNGQLPAVVYGAGTPARAISVSLIAFDKIFKQAGETGMIDLKTPEETLHVLVHDISYDPIRHVPTHADFLVVDIKKKIRVEVPLRFVGESPAAKTGLGVLVKVLHEVEVEALPMELPSSIDVDISVLAELDQQIHISDISNIPNVEILNEKEEVVAAITAIKEEVEEVVPVDMESIGISEERGKKDSPADEAGGGESPDGGAEAKSEDKKEDKK